MKKTLLSVGFWVGALWFVLSIMIVVIGASPEHPIPDMVKDGIYNPIGGAFMAFAYIGFLVGFPISFACMLKLEQIWGKESKNA